MLAKGRECIELQRPTRYTMIIVLVYHAAAVTSTLIDITAASLTSNIAASRFALDLFRCNVSAIFQKIPETNIHAPVTGLDIAASTL